MGQPPLAPPTIFADEKISFAMCPDDCTVFVIDAGNLGMVFNMQVHTLPGKPGSRGLVAAPTLEA